MGAPEAHAYLSFAEHWKYFWDLGFHALNHGLDNPECRSAIVEITGVEAPLRAVTILEEDAPQVSVRVSRYRADLSHLLTQVRRHAEVFRGGRVELELSPGLRRSEELFPSEHDVSILRLRWGVSPYAYYFTAIRSPSQAFSRKLQPRPRCRGRA